MTIFTIQKLCMFYRLTISVFVLFLGSFACYGQLNINKIHQLIQVRNKKTLADNYLSKAQEFLKTDLDSSLYYSQKTLDLADKNALNSEKIKALSILGEYYQKKSELQISIEYYLKAIEIAEKNGINKHLGSAYNGIGISYFMLNDLDQAESYIRKALDAKLLEKDFLYYSIISSNLAALYVHREKYTEAISMLMNAESIIIKNDLRFYLPNLYNSLGAAYQQYQPEKDSAIHYYSKSIEIARELNIQDNIITGLHNIGQYYLGRGNFTQAIHYLKLAEEECATFNSDPFTLKTVQTLVEVYEAMSDLTNALKYSKKELELNNRIFNAEKQKSIEELNIQYETAKQARENFKQKEEIQQAKLDAQKSNNMFYLLLFSGIALLMFVSFVSIVLIQRRANIQKLDREKIKIFENVVHEIRSPLTLIHGPLQALKSSERTEKEQEHLNLIERNASKLIHLVNELLDASKLDKGNYAVQYAHGDLEAFAAQIIAGFQQESKLKNIALSLHAQLTKQYFSFSADIIEKLLTNLISNALKYCPEESEVFVQLENNDDQLTIRVADNGAGIPKKEQKKIFERFYRLDQHKKLTGTGIGLSLVKDLVELENGSISVESDAKGTTFTISLPIPKTEQNTIKITDNQEDKIMLLLVDDDSDIIQFLTSTLEEDFIVVSASNGNEGIEQTKNQLPDIILSDVMMPEKDGIEFLQELKSTEDFKNIPFVLFSSKSAVENRLKGLNLGANGYIPKPFNPDELRLMLKNLANTIKHYKSEFKENIKSKQPFDVRIKSQKEYVNKVIAFIIQNIENPDYSVNELCDDMCISRSQLHRKLSTYTGFSTVNFINMIRLEKALDLLESNAGNVSEVAFACGFNNRSYFSTLFTEYFGNSPSSYVNQG